MTDRDAAELTKERGFRRVLARSLALPLVLSVVSAASFVGMILYLIQAHRLVEHSDRVIAVATTVQKLMVDAETGLRGYLIAGEPLFLQPKEEAERRLGPELALLHGLIGDSPSQRAHVDTAEKRYKDWLGYYDAMLELRRTGGDYVNIVRSARGKLLMDDIRKALDLVLAEEQKLRDGRLGASTATVRFLLAVSIALCLLFGAGIAVFGRRQLLELSRQFGIALRTQREQNQALERAAWVQTGLLQLGGFARESDAIETLSRSVLGFLSDYLQAPVGRLFLVEENGTLTACASYAVDDRDATLPRSYRPGEGMIGRSAAEKKILTLTDLPDDYLRVSSSLGSSVVRHVLIAPLMVGDSVRAVVELGYLSAPTFRDTEFLREASERIAQSIAATQYRARLRELVDETQRQSEELQAQQEELEAKNDDLQQKSQELLAQQQNLEQVNAELEQQQTQLEEQKERLEKMNDELNRADLDMREKAKRLEVASRYKSEFLANMSHELRTPLNSILLLSNLLTENSKKSLGAEELEYASTIHSSADDLLVLINDILDLSKVEAGKLDLALGSMPTKDLAGSLERVFLPQLKKKGLRFTVTVEPDAPATLQTDKARCEQILRNFLSNALKFTESGEVALTFRGARPDEAPYALVASVRDTGIGIGKEKQKLVFEAFQQADGSISRRYGGTGLGLTISRELATLLGGRVELESEEGKGSTFRLLLPASAPAADARPGAKATRTGDEVRRLSERLRKTPPSEEESVAATPHHGIGADPTTLSRGQRVLLIIEDDESFARVLAGLGEKKGFRVAVALNGETGIELATRLVPVAIVLDLNLPGISGVGVLERLKASAVTRHIPVHVVSVESTSRDVLLRGAFRFDRKPVESARLERMVDEIIENEKPRKKRLLVIEDNAVELRNLLKIVGNGDVVADTAATGREAVDLLRTTGYDCVILDPKLPDMSGFDVISEVNASSGGRVPPVIVYTARDLTPDEQERLSEVSQSIVLKGARSPERLLDEVTLFLHRVEGTMSPVQQEMLQRVRHRDDVFIGKKLLVVDDDIRNVFALRSALMKRGFEVVAAKTGREALQRLRENSDASGVLMDIMMPEMDGYQAIREIRANETWAKLPIIALTAKAMKGDRDRCLDAGANDYLPKPVDLNNLLSLLRIWLTK